jgi:outer membrane protein assembly factor BamB
MRRIVCTFCVLFVGIGIAAAQDSEMRCLATAEVALAGTPVRHQEMLLCRTERGVIAISDSSGKTLWEYRSEQPGRVIYSPLTICRGVAVGKFGDDLVSLDLTNGKEKWRKTIGFLLLLRPSVLVVDKGCLFSARDGLFYVDADTGKEIWNKEGTWRSAYKLDEHILLALDSSDEALIQKIDVESGQVIQKMAVGEDVLYSFGAVQDRVYCLTTKWIGDRKYTGGVTAYEMSSGNKLWDSSMNGEYIHDGAFISRDKSFAYVFGLSGTKQERQRSITKIMLNTGQQKWNISAGPDKMIDFFDVQALSERYLLAWSSEQVAILSTKDGKTLWERKMPIAGLSIDGSRALLASEQKIYELKLPAATTVP